MKLKLTEIRRYFNEPYPYYYDNQQKLILLLLSLSISSFLFSFFFEPFEVNVAEHRINSIYILLIHACIPFPIAYLYFSLINKNVANNVMWTLGKEILNLSIILLIIGIVGFLIRDLIYINPNNWSFRYFWEEIRNTFLVGSLLLIIILPLNLERLINKHRSRLKEIPSLSISKKKNLSITIKSPISNENFDFEINDFLFAKVESNYTEVFMSSSTGINKIIIRITLKELEEQLKSFAQIFKVHRSYLVNLHSIESISGNAQGYQLSLTNCAITIPVSRSNITSFNSTYSSM